MITNFWKTHTNDVAHIKCFIKFESHIHYACIIWGQNLCTINCLFILQKKALKLIHFKEHNAHTTLLFQIKNNKTPDKIKMENGLCISKYFNNKLLPIFNGCFVFFSTFHNYETSFAIKDTILEQSQNCFINFGHM